MHTMKRLVVLTTEWLPWLHGLYWYQRLLCMYTVSNCR